jgi:hypothetical protein
MQWLPIAVVCGGCVILWAILHLLRTFVWKIKHEEEDLCSESEPGTPTDVSPVIFSTDSPQLQRKSSLKTRQRLASAGEETARKSVRFQRESKFWTPGESKTRDSGHESGAPALLSATKRNSSVDEEHSQQACEIEELMDEDVFKGDGPKVELKR